MYATYMYVHRCTLAVGDFFNQGTFTLDLIYTCRSLGTYIIGIVQATDHLIHTAAFSGKNLFMVSGSTMGWPCSGEGRPLR